MDLGFIFPKKSFSSPPVQRCRASSAYL